MEITKIAKQLNGCTSREYQEIIDNHKKGVLQIGEDAIEALGLELTDWELENLESILDEDTYKVIEEKGRPTKLGSLYRCRKCNELLLYCCCK